MGHMHIENLYRPAAQTILMLREVWAMEKVHGTSAHITWRNGALTFFSGGEKHDRFVALFAAADLSARFATLGHSSVTVYGEAYGGSQQGMRATYGDSLRFIAFDVTVGKRFVSVPDMAQIADGLGLEVVPYERISTDLADLDRVRDAPSIVAERRGCGVRPREGVVLRPLVEMSTDHGRIIVKYKCAAFDERATPQRVGDPAALQVLADAEAIAQEWVTPMRLTHVLDRLMPPAADMTDTRRVIAAMVEDVTREASGEIVVSRPAIAAIGKRAASLFKERLNATIRVSR